MPEAMEPSQTVPEPQPPQEVLREFLKLYDDACNEHAANGRNAIFDSPSHVAAIVYAEQHSLTGAGDLLHAIVLSRQGKAEDAWKLVESILNRTPAGLRGKGHHTRRFVLQDLKRHDEAIREFELALALPDYDSPGTTLCGLGYTYDDMKQYDRAIQCYEKALETPGYGMPGMALDNLGNAYSEQKQYDRAIEYYEKALATPGYDAPGDALHNLGMAYDDKDQYDRAIEYYEKALAIPGYDTPHLTLCNLALSLRKAGRQREAIAQIQQVIEQPDEEQQHDRAKLIKGMIEADLAEIPVSAADEALARPMSSITDVTSPEARMRTKLAGLEDKYHVYLKRVGSSRNDTFSVLRGWSSAVTLLEGAGETHWRGGGYFLKWSGFGIVIDPGFDFVDNFHDAGFHAREVDVVLVSHNHSDHNFDLRSLDDLRFQIYRRSTEEVGDGTRKPKLKRTVFVVDDDTARAFGDDSQEHRWSPFRFGKAECQNELWRVRPSGIPITIEHFMVRHGDDVPHAVGLRLRLHRDGEPDFVVGYTGDSEYFDELPKQLAGCDLLLAHISQPDPQEFNDDNYPKEFHLGYNGVTKLIQALDPKPKLTLIGEFWAGLADLRIELIQGLRQRTRTDAILPTGLGFHVNLPSLDVECTECRKPTPFSQIRVVPPTSPFGPLGFLCQRCVI